MKSWSYNNYTFFNSFCFNVGLIGTSYSCIDNHFFVIVDSDFDVSNPNAHYCKS